MKYTYQFNVISKFNSNANCLLKYFNFKFNKFNIEKIVFGLFDSREKKQTYLRQIHRSQEIPAMYDIKYQLIHLKKKNTHKFNGDFNISLKSHQNIFQTKVRNLISWNIAIYSAQ